MKTTLYSILAAAVRIAALLMLAQTVASLFAYFAQQDAGLGVRVNWAFFVGSLIAAGIALALWLYPGILVRPAVGRAAHEVFDSTLTSDDIQRIGISIVGIWFAIGGIGGVVYALLRAGMAAQTEHYVGGALEMVRADLLASVFSVLLGVAVALGSRGLTGLLSRIRGGR
jgi:hypothetical protein